MAISAYADIGFASVRNVLGAGDLDMLRREWARLWREADLAHPRVQWRDHVETCPKADRLDSAHLFSPELKALCRDERLMRLAQAALGQPAVFFKDKLITKGSGTHGYTLHQDWAYWSQFGAPADHMVTLVVAIDSSDAANGALEVWPKEPVLLPPPADDPLDVDPAAVDGDRGALVSLAEGDVLLLHPLTPHRSAPNRSDRPRRTFFVTYVSAEHQAAATRLREEVNSLAVLEK